MIDYPLIPPPSFAGQWFSGVPVGVVCPYAGQLENPFGKNKDNLDTDQPALWLEQWGWLFCDGRELDTVEYPMLFVAIGNLYGGNGQETFCLPDYRGYFLRCTDDGRGVDPDAKDRTPPIGGNYPGVGSIQDDAVQNHQHAYQFASLGNSTMQFQGGDKPGTATPTGSGDPALPDSVSPDNPDGELARISSETRPRNIYVNYIIKSW